MAKPSFELPVSNIKGKVLSRSNGYYYMRNGKQFYRERRENYQQNQSPKQKWRSQAFAYANKQLAGKLTPEAKRAMEKEWRAAKCITPFGSSASTALGWKKSVLMYEWQQQHPFEQWYEAYLTEVSNQISERTASETISPYQIKKQIDVLSAQLVELRMLLNKTSGSANS